MSNTERRTFIKIITARAVGSFAGIAALGQDGTSPVKPESFLLYANDWVPNNPVLPIVLYQGVITPSEAAPQTPRGVRVARSRGSSIG